MKLMTALHEENGRAIVDYIDGSEVDHDALAAHALMLAMRQYEQDFPLSSACAQDVIQWIEKRADELMCEWWFDVEDAK